MTNNGPTSRPSGPARLIMGMLVAAGILGGVEALGWALRGPPPPSGQVIQISVAELVAEGADTRLRHLLEPRQDVVVPPKGDRPRLVTLGGSSVRHSWATDPAVDFPLWLQRALPQIEVVNLGTPGQTTLGILALMPMLDRLDPDLVLLYTGHNDFSEPVFQGRLAGSRLWMLPLHRLLGRSWIYASLRGPAVSLAPPQPEARRGVLVTDDYRATRWADQTLAIYDRQLGEIIDASPAPVALSTLLRNADYPPTGLLALPESQPDGDGAACRKRVAALPLHAPPGPELLARQVDTACGPGRALAWWYRSLAARAAGDLATATDHFAESLRRDPLPLRAPFEVDAVIRRRAADHGALLIDPAEALGPLPPGAWFDDTLHPNAEGARRLAGALAPPLEAALTP